MGIVLNTEERKDRDREFIRHYVENGGNATQAAIFCGVSDSSASTVGYRLKQRLVDDIEVEQKESLKGYASKHCTRYRLLQKQQSVRM